MSEQCPWTVRWGVMADSTTRCDKPAHVPEDTPLEAMSEDEYTHAGPSGVYPGQRVEWLAGDRREYTGKWPGYCDKIAKPAFGGGCCLPLGHHGRCAP